ncbi:MAG: diaminopimelate decarboxylase, partial [Syntrophaceae bacterium]|nr:diaminopimelate decarboxylase [Syntrophaceae bacterium]
NIGILNIFSKLGSGVDIVSGGELYRAIKAGIDPRKIVYSGVGKTESEIDEALEADILMFNVESEDELEAINQRAFSRNRKARIALRVNPDVDPKTHPYISTGLRTNKFGIDISRSLELYKLARTMKGIEPIGIDCHIGSQLTELAPFKETVSILKELLKTLRQEGINIKYLDVGGGLGIPYDQETPPPPSAYGSTILEALRDMDVKIILEPGRVMVGNAGILLTKVLYKKRTAEKNFVIVDAAMNDLVRPSLYKAYHAIIPVNKKSENLKSEVLLADIVGPICESGDFLARSREINTPENGDYLAVMSAGAYGFSMSSNYNSRPRACEALVDDDKFHVIRDRETYADLTRGERIPGDNI